MTTSTQSAIPAYLISTDECEFASDLCYGNCSEPVKQRGDTGRWYITMGHPGFNSPANNAAGYSTSAAALASLNRYGTKGRAR